MSCLHIKNLSVQFKTARTTVFAVDRVSLDHTGGETLALMGETGCGKSVIANSILRLLPENTSIQGEIFFKGRDLLKASEGELNQIRGQEIAIVLQNPGLALNPIKKLGKQIAEPLVIHKKMPWKQAVLQAEQMMNQLRFTGLKEKIKAYPFQFSGGMNQRVIIASSMVLDPRVIIADEPTKGLDMEARKEVMRELADIKKRKGSSLLLITHDFDLSREIADRIAIMYAGEIVEIAQNKEYFKEPLHPYAKALMQSLPENGFKPIPGPPVAMTDPPRGCKFHPRCPFRMKRCSSERPPEISTNGRKVRCFLYT
jgi:peptide/nickel transport system ATP-binding protein